jgi:hypothetical protein
VFGNPDIEPRARKTVVRARSFVAECCCSIHPCGALRWAQRCAKDNHDHDREDDRINYGRAEVNEALDRNSAADRNSATGYLFPATQCAAKRFKCCNRYAVGVYAPLIKGTVSCSIENATIDRVGISALHPRNKRYLPGIASQFAGEIRFDINQSYEVIDMLNF